MSIPPKKSTPHAGATPNAPARRPAPHSPNAARSHVAPPLAVPPAPPAYRPQPKPVVLQAKASAPAAPNAAPKAAPPRPSAPTPHRPHAKPAVQPPTRPVQMKPRQATPPAQLSRPVSKAVQAKSSFASGVAQKGAGVIQTKEDFGSVEKSSQSIGPVLKQYVEKGVWSKERCKKLARTVAHCMKNLANRSVKVEDENKGSLFRKGGSGPFAGGSENAAISTFEKFFSRLHKDGSWRKPTAEELADLFYDLIKTQNLTEGNHRGAYFAIQMVATMFEVPAPSSNILKEKLSFKQNYYPLFKGDN